jgi:hypothetical protein
MISDARAILGQLTKLGCRVTAWGDKLRVEASGAVPADLLQAARAHKADLLELVTAGAGIVHPLLLLPLDTFAAHGQPIEVRVPWWAQTLWFVPDEPHARRLEAEGVSRGRIWTAGELMDLLTIRDQPAARMAAIAKLEFGGDVVEVRPRG